MNWLRRLFSRTAVPDLAMQLESDGVYRYKRLPPATEHDGEVFATSDMGLVKSIDGTWNIIYFGP
jgi:hypothetical protein